MNTQLLTKERIEGLNEEIETCRTRLEEISQSQSEMRTDLASKKEKIKSNERENEELKREISELSHKLTMTEKAAIEQRTIVDGNEKELASDKHTKAVKEEYDRQPDFYATLQKRIARLQDELGDTFSSLGEFIEPANAAVAIRTKIEGRGFDRHLVALRGIKSQYETAIWNFAERKVRGENIQPQETKALLAVIDEMLMANDVTVYWNKG